MSRFFITGLPRSATAWLANYLTWGDTFCFHDALRMMSDPRELSPLFNSMRGVRAVGHADPANLLFQDALIDAFPGARWVLIERPRAEAQVASMHAFGTGYCSWELFEHKFDELSRKVVPLRVPFSEVQARALTIGRWVSGPQFNPPAQRCAMLRRFNVQIDPGVLNAEIMAGPTLQTERLMHHMEGAL